MLVFVFGEIEKRRREFHEWTRRQIKNEEQNIMGKWRTIARSLSEIHYENEH